jgi:hypothetical protein
VTATGALHFTAGESTTKEWYACNSNIVANYIIDFKQGSFACKNTNDPSTIRATYDAVFQTHLEESEELHVFARVVMDATLSITTGSMRVSTPIMSSIWTGTIVMGDDVGFWMIGNSFFGPESRVAGGTFTLSGNIDFHGTLDNVKAVTLTDANVTCANQNLQATALDLKGSSSLRNVNLRVITKGFTVSEKSSIENSHVYVQFTVKMLFAGQLVNSSVHTTAATKFTSTASLFMSTVYIDSQASILWSQAQSPLYSIMSNSSIQVVGKLDITNILLNGTEGSQIIVSPGGKLSVTYDNVVSRINDITLQVQGKLEVIGGSLNSNAPMAVDTLSVSGTLVASSITLATELSIIQNGYLSATIINPLPGATIDLWSGTITSTTALYAKNTTLKFHGSMYFRDVDISVDQLLCKYDYSSIQSLGNSSISATEIDISSLTHLIMESVKTNKINITATMAFIPNLECQDLMSLGTRSDLSLGNVRMGENSTLQLVATIVDNVITGEIELTKPTLFPRVLVVYKPIPVNWNDFIFTSKYLRPFSTLRKTPYPRVLSLNDNTNGVTSMDYNSDSGNFTLSPGACMQGCVHGTCNKVTRTCDCDHDYRGPRCEISSFAPYAPENVLATPNLGYVVLTWQANLTNNVTTYRVKVAYKIVFIPFSGTTYTWIHNQTVPGVNYTYTIVGVNEHGDGEIASTITTAVDVPPIPSVRLSSSALQSVGFRIEPSFAPTYPPITRYSLYRNNSLVYTERRITGEIFDYTTQKGSYYSYNVVAQNALGNTSSMPIIVHTYELPGTPQNMTAYKSGKYVYINWIWPTQIGYPYFDGYNVKRDNKLIYISLGPRTFTDAVPDIYTTYTYSVTAKSMIGESVAASVTIKGDAKPTLPSPTTRGPTTAPTTLAPSSNALTIGLSVGGAIFLLLAIAAGVTIGIVLMRRNKTYVQIQ